MKLDLLLKETPDLTIRENFFRLKRDLEAQQILSGFWNFYEVEFTQSGSSLPIKHNLSFVPKDIIILAVEGDHNVFFNHEKFDATNIYVTVSGPCRIRFFAGKYSDKTYGGSQKEFPFVPVNGGGGSSGGSTVSNHIFVGSVRVLADSGFSIAASTGVTIKASATSGYAEIFGSVRAVSATEFRLTSGAALRIKAV